jgi:plastocyanin
MRKTLLAAGTIALLGCGSDSPTDTNDPAGGPTVEVRNNNFTPTPISVALNETVTFQWNSGGVIHNVTFQDQGSPASPNQGSGSFARAFQVAGSYPYVCTIHAAEGMAGVVNVSAGTGGAGGGGGGGGGGAYP